MTAEEILKGKVETISHSENDKVLYIHYWNAIDAINLSRQSLLQELKEEITEKDYQGDGLYDNGYQKSIEDILKIIYSKMQEYQGTQDKNS